MHGYTTSLILFSPSQPYLKEEKLSERLDGIGGEKKVAITFWQKKVELSKQIILLLSCK